MKKFLINEEEKGYIKNLYGLLNEDIGLSGFEVKNGDIVIDNKYRYKLEGYGGMMVGWLNIPIISLKSNGMDLVMEYQKPPLYTKKTDTIPKSSIDYIKSKLGAQTIEPPSKTTQIRLVKTN
jgi:hypothetical protein